VLTESPQRLIFPTAVSTTRDDELDNGDSKGVRCKYNKGIYQKGENANGIGYSAKV
jgi:hypothetical protein